jgi:hypothetical protein
MRSFFQALGDMRKDLPDYEEVINNILIDRRSPANPFGISERLEQSLDEASDNISIFLVIKGHSILRKPDLHTKANIEAKQVKRVMSRQIFVRYHLVDGRSSSDYTSSADLGWQDIESIIEGGKQSLTGSVIARQSFEPEQLHGITGKEDSAVFWTWDEDGIEYQGTGEQYMRELALSDFLLHSAATDDVVVEVSLEKDKHPGEFFRPTGLDCFSPEARFYPNIHTGECFGRTRPIPPADPSHGRPEAINAPVRYTDLDDVARIEVTFFKY